MPAVTKLKMKAVLDPEGTCCDILKTAWQTSGDVKTMAKVLGTSTASLYRLMADLQMTAPVQKIRAKAAKGGGA